jgi:hypothetical protein
MDLVDKTTFAGREVREYGCEPCQKNMIEHGGPALWQVLSDAREEAERERQAKEGEKGK